MSTPTYKPIQLPDPPALSLGSTNDQAHGHTPIFRIEKVGASPVVPPSSFNPPDPVESTKNDTKVRIPLVSVKLPPPLTAQNLPIKHEYQIESPPGPILKPEVKAPEIIRLDRVERAKKIRKYLQKKQKRNWDKGVVYYTRKKCAENRVRVNGRFVNKETEMIIQKSCESRPSKKRSKTKRPTTKLECTQNLPVVQKPVFAFTRTRALDV